MPTFTVTTRELRAAPPNPAFVRLEQVDGLIFPDPLQVEGYRECSEREGGGMGITVWSPKGWMFEILVSEVAQGGREITVTFNDDEPLPDHVQLGYHSDGTPCFDDDRICY